MTKLSDEVIGTFREASSRDARVTALVKPFIDHIDALSAELAEANDEKDYAERELAKWKEGYAEAHRRMDAAGIPSAVGVECNDPKCDSHLVHRVHDMLERLAAATADNERLQKELKLWRPMTDEEAERALDEARAEPISDDEINAIVVKVTDPTYRPTEPQHAQMAAKIERLTAELAEAKKKPDLDCKCGWCAPEGQSHYSVFHCKVAKAMKAAVGEDLYEKHYRAVIGPHERELAHAQQSVCDFQAASMLESGGDPSQIKPEHVEREIVQLREQLAEARKQLDSLNVDPAKREELGRLYLEAYNDWATTRGTNPQSFRTKWETQGTATQNRQAFIALRCFAAGRLEAGAANRKYDDAKREVAALEKQLADLRAAGDGDEELARIFFEWARPSIQWRQLSDRDKEDIREGVKHVAAPLRLRIAELEKERDEANARAVTFIPDPESLQAHNDRLAADLELASECVKTHKRAFEAMQADRDKLAGELAAAQQALAAARRQVEGLQKRYDFIKEEACAVSEVLKDGGGSIQWAHRTLRNVLEYLADDESAASPTPAAASPDRQGQTISKPGAAIEMRVVPMSDSVKSAISRGLQEGTAAASPVDPPELDVNKQAREFRCPKCGGTEYVTSRINSVAEFIVCSGEDCNWRGTWAEVAAAREGEQGATRRETTTEPETWYLITCLNRSGVRVPASIWPDEADASWRVSHHFCETNQARVETVVRKSAYAAERSAREAAEKRAELAEAGAAAMRAACDEDVPRSEDGSGRYWTSIAEFLESIADDTNNSHYEYARGVLPQLNAALKPDAGRKLLDEVRAMEKFVNVIKTIFKEPWSDVSRCNRISEELPELDQALAASGAGREGKA